ncbi:MAG: hypothetical protein RLZZ349_1070, partial [Pseudomonadota bacterium]
GCCSYVCPSDIPLVQYYRYAKSEVIASDKAKEAADLARERNEFRLARIEREKLERTQKHAERAQAGKAEIKSVEVNTTHLSLEKDETVANAQTTTLAPTDKQAAIAAAIARAKALKIASTLPVLAADNKSSAPTTNEAQAKQDKQAMIAAAIERAKAAKLAAIQAGVSPKNIENVSATIQTEINETDAIREKVNITTKTKVAD